MDSFVKNILIVGFWAFLGSTAFSAEWSVPERLCAARIAEHNSPAVKAWVDHTLQNNPLLNSTGEIRERLLSMTLQMLADPRFRSEDYFVYSSLLGASSEEMLKAIEMRGRKTVANSGNALEYWRLNTVANYFLENDEEAHKFMNMFFQQPDINRDLKLYQSFVRGVARMGGGDAGQWEQAQVALLRLVSAGNRHSEYSREYMFAFDIALPLLSGFRTEPFIAKANLELVRIGDSLTRFADSAKDATVEWVLRLNALRAYAATGPVLRETTHKPERFIPYLYGSPPQSVRSKMQAQVDMLLIRQPDQELPYHDLFDLLSGLDDSSQMALFGPIAESRGYRVAFDFYMASGDFESAKRLAEKWISQGALRNPFGPEQQSLVTNLVRSGHTELLQQLLDQSVLDSDATEMVDAALKLPNSQLLEIGSSTRYLRSFGKHDIVTDEVRAALGLRLDSPFRSGPFAGTGSLFAELADLSEVLGRVRAGNKPFAVHKEVAYRTLENESTSLDELQIAMLYFLETENSEAMIKVASRMFAIGMEPGYRGDAQSGEGASPANFAFRNMALVPLFNQP